MDRLNPGCDSINGLRIEDFNYTAGLWTAYPFAYETIDAEAGISCDALNVSIFCTFEEWDKLQSVWYAYRRDREDDVPVYFPSGSDLSLNIREYVGTTVTVNAEVHGTQWSSVKCYFLEEPRAEQFGQYLQVTVKLVDAEQWVNAYYRKQELSLYEGINYFGVFDLWGVELGLRNEPKSYQDIPNLSLSAGGVSYVTGPVNPTLIHVIEGDTNANGWKKIMDEYKKISASVPTSGVLFPVTAPKANVQKRVSLRLGRPQRDDIYTVSITVAEPQTSDSD